MKKLLLTTLCLSPGLFGMGSNAKIITSDTHEQSREQAQRLFSAITAGDVEETLTALEDGANVNATDYQGNTPLIVAAEGGHIELCRLLLDRGANVNAVNPHGLTPLIFASYRGHIEVCMALVGRGASVNAKDSLGSTPLTDAAEEGHAEVCELLLDRGAEVNAVNERGNTPLMEVARKGHAKVCLALLEHGANVNVAEGENNPLTAAARNGLIEVCQALLQRGANVNATDKLGVTPLKAAASNGHTEVKQLLLSNGAKVNEIGRHLRISLFSAIIRNSTGMCQLLLEHMCLVPQPVEAATLRKSRGILARLLGCLKTGGVPTGVRHLILLNTEELRHSVSNILLETYHHGGLNQIPPYLKQILIETVYTHTIEGLPQLMEELRAKATSEDVRALLDPANASTYHKAIRANIERRFK